MEKKRKRNENTRARRKAWEALARKLPDNTLHLLVLVLLPVLLSGFFYPRMRTVAGTISALIAILYIMRTRRMFRILTERDEELGPTIQRVIPMVLLFLLFVAICIVQFMDPTTTANYWCSVGLGSTLCLIYILVPWFNYGTCPTLRYQSRMVVPMNRSYLALDNKSTCPLARTR